MWHFVTFDDRAMIHITGADAHDFLQGLVTQDVEKLSPQNPLLYSAFLTPQGKFLYDFFIWYLDDETIGLELHKDDAVGLITHLTRYKLRKDVDINLKDQNIYQIFGGDDDLNFARDPRHKDLGYKSLSKPEMLETNIETWTKHRLKHDVPNCRVDLRNGLSSPFEGNIDLLNGIAFNKGCYLGQELVSRIHHRGLVKRRFPNL